MKTTWLPVCILVHYTVYLNIHNKAYFLKMNDGFIDIQMNDEI